MDGQEEWFKQSIKGDSINTPGYPKHLQKIQFRNTKITPVIHTRAYGFPRTTHAQQVTATQEIVGGAIGRPRPAQRSTPGALAPPMRKCHISKNQQSALLSMMVSPQSLSFKELLCGVPEEKRYLLDCQVKNDRHLAEIARKVTDWNLVLPYLIMRESVETEEAILGNYHTVERRRLVTSRVTESLNRFIFNSMTGW